MNKIQNHIEIVRSTSLALSSLSQASCDAIFAVLSHHYTDVGISIVNNLTDLERLVSKQPDLAFMGMKYLPGITFPIWISDYLETYGIAHTGSGQPAIEFELNKPLAKQRVFDAGISTAAFVVVKIGQTFTNKGFLLDFPVFVKPANLGGGQGINAHSVAHNFQELSSQVNSVMAECGTDILVEEYLPGREFSVAVLANEHTDELLCLPIELVAPGNDQGELILSEVVKASNEEVVLAVNDLQTRAAITDCAAQVFNALGASDYGRIDIRLDASGSPHFLEANLIPSLIDGYGSFPKACALNVDMDYETMILRIVRLGLGSPLPAEEPDTEADLAALFGAASV